MSDKKVLRFGVVAITVALLLRLTVSLWAPAVQALEQLQLGQVLLFLQTGRILRFAPTPELTQAASPEPEPAVATFTAEDQALVQLYGGATADIAAALQQALSWNLYADQPTVLILHSHGSESYTNTEGYPETSSYRTLSTDHNMVSIGDQLAAELESAGIRVLHDRTLHDVPSYNGSYVQSRAAMETYLAQNPGICLVLDLHRDAAEDQNGQQVGYTVTTAQGDTAKLMLVLGTNHDNWQSNLALAAKLQVQLEKQCPGICRPMNLRNQRFNQDLCAGALLVEVGATGNTRQEALLAAKQLAAAIISLAAGT